jgi:CRISPR/Cas system CSM-associated protein Csm3 (group 7 of RAMP superfamily)
MPSALWSGATSRKIHTHIVVQGEMVLQTPAHLGSGDGDDLTDMPLLFDSADGKTPLLTGTSTAGALRSYLRARERGYFTRLPNPYDPTDKNAVDTERKGWAVKLFGGFRSDDEGEQSPLIVDDAFGELGSYAVEMRDGVRLMPDSRTAADKAKFDLQLWQAGTIFRLHFELAIREIDDANTLRQALVTALEGFNDGGIKLGARKRRGYGNVHVAQWLIKTFDLRKPQGLLDWIEHGADQLTSTEPEVTIARTADEMRTALGAQSPSADRRTYFSLDAIFSLEGSLLIRSGQGRDDKGPDTVHLHSVRANGPRDPNNRPVPQPILSGTSLGGALRARARKIATSISPHGNALALVDSMFGVEMKKGVSPRASRAQVEETVIVNGNADLVQNRVSIDRFTGGARETALFNEQPVFGGDDTSVEVKLSLFNPSCAEIGLLLLLLKDLWTKDLPLGGEASVGRGRLKGRSASLTYQPGGQPQLTWKIESRENDALWIAGDKTTLESYVAALHAHLKG